MSQQPFPAQDDRGAAVLVAYASGQVQTELLKLIAGLGFRALVSEDGDDALRLLEEHVPALMVVDVGIEGRASFELCDHIRAHNLPTRVILVASVYRKTRYKRRPASLYGADDYVEQHHIHDLLPRKMAALLGGRGRWDAERFVDRERVGRFGDCRMEIPPADRGAALAAARRLAWVIVSDIALYNPELMNLPQERFGRATAADLEEGRRLFMQRVPEELREAEDFMANALRRLRSGRL